MIEKLFDSTKQQWQYFASNLYGIFLRLDFKAVQKLKKVYIAIFGGGQYKCTDCTYELTAKYMSSCMPTLFFCTKVRIYVFNYVTSCFTDTCIDLSITDMDRELESYSSGPVCTAHAT